MASEPECCRFEPGHASELFRVFVWRNSNFSAQNIVTNVCIYCIKENQNAIDKRVDTCKDCTSCDFNVMLE